MSYMGHVSRPLIALLVGTVAFFAVWTIALKPKSSSSGGSGSSAAGAYQSAIDKAHQAVTTSNNASVAHGGTVATTAATTTAATSTPAPAAQATATTPTAAGSSTKAAAASTTGTKPSSSQSTAVTGTAKDRSALVVQALRAHKVVALLFFNPLASDDRAVEQELASISVRSGKVVKLAVPLKELSRYHVVTNQVPVNASPTLVLIDRSWQATTLIGYATAFELTHRIDDALAVK
jgi:hypothetical protein